MNQPDPPPGLFKSWARLYWLVVIWLVALIILFQLFTSHFS